MRCEDRTVQAFWQAFVNTLPSEAHRRFFGRECERFGAPFQEDDLVVCERFEVVYRGD